MELLAHSARPDLGISSQAYAQHVKNVIEAARENATQVAIFSRQYGERLLEGVCRAAAYHDLGKLDELNQAVLNSGTSGGSLPINHVDAGVAYLLSTAIANSFGASMVFSHHVGLPDFQDQRNQKPGFVFRDATVNAALAQTTKSITDERLADYLALHRAIAPQVDCTHDQAGTPKSGRLSPLLLRIALSCLVDADHTDTAGHYGGSVRRCEWRLEPDTRLAMLDEYVSGLGGGQQDTRNTLRKAIYEACRNAAISHGVCSCDSSVGTGKTTAVMAHLLRVASAKGLRRIFVVLPFTNIIDQSVDVYRRSLVGPQERPEEIIAAHHHRAEFDSVESRQYAFHWHAPIVVTTAVQFFETLAAHKPSALRKLHNLPGSAVFIDEAHAALPAHLWPQAWRWIRELESHWSCHFVLGSGSLNRFWELEEFSPDTKPMPQLLTGPLRRQVFNYETGRIRYESKPDCLSKDELLEWLPALPGPRLLIVNTVQSAAVIAAALAETAGRQGVEHLSTALCPHDRKITLERVKLRLKDPSDTNWTLVATSCVEAGVELSFRTGLRERSSLNSLIQIGGRVNRAGEFGDSTVWDFEFRFNGLLRDIAAFRVSSQILSELFDEDRVDQEWCTEAMRREIRHVGLKQIHEEIEKAEQSLQFPLVSRNFRVIDGDTVTAVVDQELIKKLKMRSPVDFNLFQQLSVQIWRHREFEYALKPILGFKDIFAWTLLYDEFVGYMAGVLQNLMHKQFGTIV